MNKYYNPHKNEWNLLLQRPALDFTQLSAKVQEVFNQVKLQGDKALQQFTLQFDGIELAAFKVTDEEILNSEKKISVGLKNALHIAYDNIKKFHEQQLAEEEPIVETTEGVHCWRKSVAIEKVGAYIPGGSAPLFSTVLMLAIPAQTAGCREIILCTPPDKHGGVHPAILYAAKLAGVHKIYKLGGVQAIAAMAFGTETVPKVYKIFGPGNQYVTCAKQLAQQQGIAIDMPAGPSEVCILADKQANAHFVAADMLSQAEHGKDSQALLITTCKELINEVEQKVEMLLSGLERREIAKKSLENSKLIFFEKQEDAIDFINQYAAEHLIIAHENAEAVSKKIYNAGSVFLGNYSPESAGDYASGTNHTLPTNGFARAYSGVSVDSFIKKITYQKLSKQGLYNIADTVIEMANAEGLGAHALAVKVRKETINE